MSFDSFLKAIGERDAHWLLLDGISPHSWSHEITRQPKVLGRKRTNHIVLADQLVSRFHAEIFLQNNQVVLRDRGSRNGTIVQGKRIVEAVLQSGDFFKIEKFVMQVVDTKLLRFQVEMLASSLTSEPFLQANLERRDSSDPKSGDTVDCFLRQKCPAVDELSKAQIRVLRLLLRGSSEAQIAGELFVSPNTVHSHVKAIYKTIGVGSRPALMAEFIDPDLKVRK